MTSTIDLLNQHRSIRRYADDAPIPESHIRQAVQAGQSASTSSAVQSYCLIRVTDQAQREALVELTGGQTKVARAGAFFIVCGDTRRHRLLAERAGKPFQTGLEAFLLAIVDATLFAQNLVVAFESLGYGICYIGGLRNQLFDVQEVMGFPHGIYPLYGLTVGRPAEQPLPRPRLPMDSVYFEGAYPDDKVMLGMIDEYDGVYRDYLERRGATPGKWSDAMAGKFESVRRADLASYYEAQGAVLETVDG